ncbi:3-methylaspartate ammonia-lyase [Shinella sp. SUS2]|uniref:acyclic terpene utilization AtuA family protein n=1 Tax=unclassified Shinella TaxID=2643062 RepID=UPI0006807ED5|nr:MULTISPECIES: acyclic terpene utilization AtuA family protein [unclassified Shinella]KNY13253.1 3-methylaspartate ammonia-lyase [Shinella sp. SUS2]KOC72062.1 3-methylaspartate ammonia-lyase [Shinella sp. GWS1]
MDEIRILSPTAILGYGFPEASFEEGLQRQPHVIAVDAGSSDPGPYYLGAGVSFTDRAAVKRDLKIILRAGNALGIPVIIGSAGGAGAKPHLDWTAEIIREIASEDALALRFAMIDSEVEKGVVEAALNEGRIASCGGSPKLALQDIRQCSHIVAQAGIEPILRSLTLGANVILAGRAYDPSVFGAFPAMHGFDLGLALHMGKILECAAIASIPGSGSDCMIGTLRRDNFELEPLNPSRKCTVASVAAHSLYEKSDPYLLPGPGGVLDLTDARFEQIDERRVRVSGSRHVDAPYAVKLEGARRVGHRYISFAGVRDPIFIAQIDDICSAVRARTAENFTEIGPKDYRLIFRIYGRDAVLGAIEPVRDAVPHEVGIVIEAVAHTALQAKSICSFARSSILHLGYPGRLSTAGNLAFPYSPSDFDAGEVFEFSVYHLMRIDDPTLFFPTVIENIGPTSGAGS